MTTRRLPLHKRVKEVSPALGAPVNSRGVGDMDRSEGDARAGGTGRQILRPSRANSSSPRREIICMYTYATAQVKEPVQHHRRWQEFLPFLAGLRVCRGVRGASGWGVGLPSEVRDVSSSGLSSAQSRAPIARSVRVCTNVIIWPLSAWHGRAATVEANSHVQGCQAHRRPSLRYHLP